MLARCLRNAGAFVVGLLLSVLVLLPYARAETIPATNNPTAATLSSVCYRGSCFSTAAAALAKCNQQDPGWCNAGSWYTTATGNFQNLCNSSGSCAGYGLQYTYSCTTGTLTPGTEPAPRSYTCAGAQTYTCPANQNWTLSGSNCTRPDCASGQSRSTTDGQCRGACPADGTKDANFGKDKVGSGDIPSTLCIDGCSYTPAGLGVGMGSGPSAYWLLTVGRANGASCSTSNNSSTGIPGTSNGTPAEQATTPQSDCVKSGQGFGTVNGTVVCTGPPTVTQEKTTTQTQTTPTSGPATTTETTKTTTCQGGVCVTTETSKVVGGGSGPGGTGPGSTSTPGPTTTTTDDEGTFCDKNPTSDKCQKTEPGTPAPVTGLYTKDSKTVASVIDTFKSTVQGAAFYTAAAGYFSASIPSGSCSGLSVNVSPPLGSTWHLDLGDYLCGSFASTLYSLLGIGVMLAAGWVAFRVAIL